MGGLPTFNSIKYMHFNTFRRQSQCYLSCFSFGPPVTRTIFRIPLTDFDARNDVHLHNMSSYLQYIGPIHSRPQFKDNYISPDLIECTRVHLRHKISNNSALDTKYIGPLKVLYKGNTYWNVQYNGQSVKVSINRLKAAHYLPA